MGVVVLIFVFLVSVRSFFVYLPIYTLVCLSVVGEEKGGVGALGMEKRIEGEERGRRRLYLGTYPVGVEYWRKIKKGSKACLVSSDECACVSVYMWMVGSVG